MIDARKDFRLSPNGKSWNDVVDSGQFQEAVKVAFLEHSRATSTLDHATAGLKIIGAQEFLIILMHLCDTARKPEPRTDPLNLNPIK